jgi:hypothetical protein
MSEEKSVLDAVNAALGDTIAEPADAAVDDTDITPSPDNEGDLGDGDAKGDQADAEGDEKPEGEGDAEEGEPEGEKGPNGERERNPDGTWKKAETPKVEDPAKKEPPKKDPINDPIPKDLKKETSERIRTLIDTTKTVTAERDEIKQNFDYMVNGIQATGATPEQYGETLSWLALFNSNNPQQQEKALELVENVAERLATLLGKERTVGDPLSAHEDLKQAVAKGQITAQYAKEIARTRNGQTFRTELTTTATQAEQAQRAATQERETARADLTALEQTLQGTDPQYAQKKALLVPVLQPIFAAIPPNQWKAKFQEAYKALKISAPASKPVAKGVPLNQPLRARQPSGGATKAPSSMLEAVSGALEGMKK